MIEVKHPPIRVAVIPPTPAFNRNALFESRRLDHSSHSPNTHWMDCFAAVYEKGKELNVLFGTVNVISRQDADVLIYMTQPISPRDVMSSRQRYPKQKVILVMYETSLGARYASNPKNHLGYDAIITYVDKYVDDKRYFFLHPRAFFRDRITRGLPFEERRMACLVGTNRKMRYRTGVVAMRNGWRFSFTDWIDYAFCPGELITLRSEVGRMCAKYRDRGFDVFGEGWDLLPETRYVCQGVPGQCVLEYIGNYRYYFAFENHSSACSLISERVWDALWGDTVPLYLGNTKLSEFIPSECYIDGRQFQSAGEMLDCICDMPEKIWRQYHSAGREFIHSDAVNKFLPEAFAERFVHRVAAIARSESVNMLTHACCGSL